jgi:phospholipid transport system substrate-binding protein
MKQGGGRMMMAKYSGGWFVIGITMMLLYPQESFLQRTTPTETVKTLLGAIQTTTDAHTTVSKTPKEEAKKTVNNILALPELSQRSLDDHWGKLTADEQKRFVQLLTALLEEVAYPNAGKFFGGLEIRYQNEKVEQEKALVRTIVTHPKEGKVSIDYELRLRNGQWIVWDIFLDEVSLATNLHTQFQAVLAENSFTELLRRMQEKLDEAKK